MSRTRKTLLALAAVQTILIAIGATHFEFARLGLAGLPFALWGAISGSDSQYGFFAPGVGSDMRATFEITDARGKTTVDTLAGAGSRELRLRIGNIVRTLGEEAEKTKVRRALAASWAGKMFARHPDARSIVVRMEDYDLPSMQESARGASGGWGPFYRATFRLAERGEAR